MTEDPRFYPQWRLHFVARFFLFSLRKTSGVNITVVAYFLDGCETCIQQFSLW